MSERIYQLQYYSGAMDFPSASALPGVHYMIATTPRSGSTNLALRMWKTGLLGAPMEYLNPAHISDLSRRLGARGPMDYWARLQGVRTSPNGCFGFKAFVTDFRYIAQTTPDLLPHLRADRVIFLYRRNVDAQAVSLARAIQTGSWFSTVEERQPPEYDFAAIQRSERNLVDQNAKWAKILEATAADVMRVSFEDYMAAPAATISQLQAFLGIDGEAANLDLPGLEKQSDATSRAWQERYAEEKARLPMATAT